MNTKKTLIASLVLASIATVSAFTFAANTSTGQNVMEGIKQGGFHGMMNGFQGTGDMMRGNKGFGPLSQFIDQTNLTDDQKTQLKTLMDANKEKIKPLMDQMRSATTDEQKTTIKTQLESIHKEFLSGLQQFVSSDKLSDFQNFVANAPVMMEGPRGFGGHEGRGGRGERGDRGNRGEIGGLGRFIDFSKLTDEQKSAINESHKNYLNSLKPYVSSDKLQEFNTFIDNVGKAPQIPVNSGSINQ